MIRCSLLVSPDGTHARIAMLLDRQELEDLKGTVAKAAGDEPMDPTIQQFSKLLEAAGDDWKEQLP